MTDFFLSFKVNCENMENIIFDEIFKEIEIMKSNDSLLAEKCLILSQGIVDRKWTIHKVVENLGSLLVDKASEKRELGTLVLSTVLESLPINLLNSTELNFIVAFYTDRLKDNHQVIPAVLRGILAMAMMQELPEGASYKLLNALFENVPCQQQQLIDRQLIYRIFKEILNRRAAEAIAMGIDFVLGVIQAIDGERDPRNLLTIFNWLPQFLSTVKLGHLAEEMFDVIACYFPVDFRSPSQDAQKVSREDLAHALSPCLCAVPEFAEFCLPLMIDKLSSNLKIAKYDSLNLLTESCKVFGVTHFQQHSHDIWNLLQKESLSSSDSDVEEASLNAISAVINKLSFNEDKTFFNETVDNLYDTLRGNLKPDTKLFLSSSKILLATTRASKESCKKIAPPVVELLLNHFNLTRDINQRQILFRTLVEFAIAYIKLYEITDISSIKTLNEIPTLCLESLILRDSALKVISFESISRITKVLPLSFRTKFYTILKREIVNSAPEFERNAFLKCFKMFSNVYKTEIIVEFLSSTSNINTTDLNSLQLYLEALIFIISDKDYAFIILPKILEYGRDLSTSKIAILCLQKLILEHSGNQFIQAYLYTDCNILGKVNTWTVMNQTDLNVLTNVSQIVKTVIGYQNAETQVTIIDLYVNRLINEYCKNCSQDNLIILDGFIICLRPELHLPNKFQLIRKLFESSSCVQESCYTYACILIANILNKSTEDENFINILFEIDGYVNSILNSDNSNKTHVSNIIQLISWLTKSLIIKGSNQADIWTDKLIALLGDYEEIAKSFKLIMDDSHDSLSAKSFCTNRLLYRQKFFAYVCKKLSSSYNKNTPNHLLALGYLLQLAPLQVIILYFKETLKLLIFCLELCYNPEVLCAVLNTLCVLIESKERYLEKHIDDLLPRFLNLTTFEESMKVRIAALKCIELFPNGYPLHKLIPHQQSVIFELAKSLDDKKRLVRRQAVDTRSKWFLLGAST